MTARNLVFAMSANLVQSVAKILRDPPFEPLKYDVRSLHVTACRIMRRVPEPEACFIIRRISVYDIISV